jgi:hypothetical protein
MRAAVAVEVELATTAAGFDAEFVDLATESNCIADDVDAELLVPTSVVAA